MAERIRNT